MHQFRITFFVILTYGYVFSQTSPMITDRPGIADPPFPVPQNTFQTEIGADYLYQNHVRHIQLPNTLLRIGITQKTEFRFYAKHVFSSDSSTQNFNSTFHPIGLGAKINLCDQKLWVPYIGIMTHVYFPTKYPRGTSYISKMGFDLFLLFQHNIGERFSINYNVGAFQEYSSVTPLWMSSWCFNEMFTSKLGVFVEYYNVKGYTFLEHAFDGGLTFLLKPNCQFDLSVGLSQFFWSNKQEPRTINYFFSGGISFRLGS